MYFLNPLKRKAEWLDWTAWETRIAQRVMDADQRERGTDDSSDDGVA